MTAPTLTEFLLARIAEDEAMAAEWPSDGRWGAHPDGGMWLDVAGRPVHAPRERVLAECEAKRRRVELILDLSLPTVDAPAYTHALLRLEAIPYADHPDYDEAWRA